MQGHPGAIWHEHSLPTEAGIQAGWCDDNEKNAGLRRHTIHGKKPCGAASLQFILC